MADASCAAKCARTTFWVTLEANLNCHARMVHKNGRPVKRSRARLCFVVTRVAGRASRTNYGENESSKR